jgi:hypothetical protein
MASISTILSDEMQDQLDRLAIERTDRLCHIACKARNYNTHQLYLIMQKDGVLAAIDMEIARICTSKDCKPMLRLI